MSDSFNSNAKLNILTSAEVQNSMDTLQRILSRPIPRNAEHFIQSLADQLATKSKDAYLIDLGEQLSKAYEQQVLLAEATDDQYNPAYEKSWAIVCKIDSTPATTLEGLKVKAQALQWLRGGGNYIDCMGSDTTDMRLIGSILDGLHKIEVPA
ncbi:hypothetical protein [Ahrensia sp. 13_GOM-1096m]|uniref:hypothetical protein n=1 Tax=Ahrensia sp. 13_GOM-1096m TaxID=1380380 RepID=UPI00047B46AB|nr:hypothetical protein [Ahrensia sp. 13_GOM-1096m]